MEHLPRLLLIDDEEPFRETLAKRLKETGYEVLDVGSGMDALALLDKEKIDIIITDIQMPGLSGLEILSEIRAKHIGVEVIMLTGHGEVSSAVEGMRLGEYEYLVVKIQEAYRVKRERDERLKKAEERSLLDKLESSWSPGRRI